MLMLPSGELGDFSCIKYFYQYVYISPKDTQYELECSLLEALMASHGRLPSAPTKGVRSRTPYCAQYGTRVTRLRASASPDQVIGNVGSSCVY